MREKILLVVLVGILYYFLSEFIVSILTVVSMPDAALIALVLSIDIIIYTITGLLFIYLFSLQRIRQVYTLVFLSFALFIGIQMLTSSHLFNLTYLFLLIVSLVLLYLGSVFSFYIVKLFKHRYSSTNSSQKRIHVSSNNGAISVKAVSKKSLKKPRKTSVKKNSKKKITKGGSK